MFNIQSKIEIEKISQEILKQSNSLDIFPTPVENIVQYAELFVDLNVNLSTINKSLLEHFSQGVDFVIGKIRGILDREEKIIYLDLTQNGSRQNFVKLHEVGHEVLPWQKKVLKYLDDDSTLDEQTKEEFEAEANYFASTILFQNDRFLKEMTKLPLCIESSLHLAKHFGSSVHSALRKYVEHNNKRCSLLVLGKISNNGVQPRCQIRNYFQSVSFTNEFGTLEWGKKLGYTWSFVKDFYHGKRFSKDGFINLDTKNGRTPFKYHFFYNGWNAFVLFMPIGEENNVKKNIIFEIK